MKANIYRYSQLLEERKFFRSYQNAVNYCKYICPKIYGAGVYNFVILK